MICYNWSTCLLYKCLQDQPRSRCARETALNHFEIVYYIMSHQVHHPNQSYIFAYTKINLPQVNFTNYQNVKCVATSQLRFITEPYSWPKIQDHMFPIGLIYHPNHISNHWNQLKESGHTIHHQTWIMLFFVALSNIRSSNMYKN